MAGLEHSPIFSLMGCLLMGAAVGTLAWSAQGDFSRWLGYLESDLADKLRRLRVPTHNLHRYVVVWLSVTGANFVVFWLVLASPVFAVLLSVFLLCGPWYLLRRMAQRRRQKIEDQLADAMVMLANAVVRAFRWPRRWTCWPRNPPARSIMSSARSWASTTWASRWNRPCRRPARGCGARISPSLPRR